jgi:PBSX family phage terminase large subunit
VIDWEPFGEKSLNFIFTPIENDARINILEGSVRSSKTVSMIPKWLRYIRNGPRGLLVIVGVSKDTVYDNVLRDLFDTVGSENFRYNRQTGDLRIFGRDVKVIGAKDEGSEKYLRGKTLAGAYVDEGTLIPEKFFKQLLNRLSIKGAKLYLTTNPDTPAHYLFKEFINDPEKLESGLVRVWHFILEDNPNLDPQYVIDIKRSYSGLFYKRFILGMWVAGHGAIYDMFSDDHIYDEMPLREHIWATGTHYVAVDYGTQNATVFLHIIDDGVNLWVDDEYYHTGREGAQKTDGQYAADLQAFMQGKPIRYVIVDPSAASFKAELRARNVRTKDADNEVLDGIRMTASMLTLGRLKFHSRCKRTISEMQGYQWDPKKSERGLEEPLKSNDHGCDGTRYGVKTIVNPRRLAA